MLLRISFFLSLLFFLSCTISNKREQPNFGEEKLFTLLNHNETGVDFKNPVKEDRKNNHLTNDMLISGAGVAVGDINQDGLPDLFFTGNQVQDRLYLNKGNMKFEDITRKAGIKKESIWSSGATMADVDQDGDLDIYVCKYVYGKEQQSENLLYINQGDLTFAEKAREFGLADRGFAVQATFFDFDMDGLLDLYLVNQPPSTGNRRGNKITLTRFKSLLYTDKIFKNTGDGHFYDVTDWTETRNLSFGLSATMGDFNNDGLPDLYVANDYEKPDYLYMNQGRGKFANTINRSMKHISNFSMGTDVADFDNDGYLDIVCVDMVPEDHKRIKTNMGGMRPEAFWDIVKKGWHYQYMFNTLQRNNGDGVFSELAQIAGISNTDWSWAPLFADFDNDGWKDLFITNGVKRAMRNSDLDAKYSKMLDSLEIVAKAQGKEVYEIIDLMQFVEMAPVEKLVNYIFKNNGDLTFSKKMKEWGMDVPTLSYGSAYADLDLDGDVDLIVNNTDDYAFIYRNNAREKGLGNYLNFSILDKKGMPAYGARVRLFKDGKFWQMAELTNARGYKSKSEDVLHFGLGKEVVVEKVEITWTYGEQLILKNVKANQLLTPNISKARVAASIEKEEDSKVFFDVSRALKVNYRHRENAFDDYKKQVLLPHKMSNFGPGLATTDVNADGLDDFYVGGAAGFPGALFLQKKDKTFQRASVETWEKDKRHEDLGASFFDADADGDLDLYVVSGGNEFEGNAPELQDRLYRNDGIGNFRRAPESLPEMRSSGSCVVPADFDGDGDVDLFVGGRLVPGKWPLPAKSYLLRNENGKFKDVTRKLAPQLLEAGLVTAATWSDFNGDGDMDLAIVGEWMPLLLLENKGNHFENVTEKAGLAKTTGWYYSILSADFDKDGDLDFVAGNLGLNYKYKASQQEPFEVFASDFDNNGQLDIVLSYYEQGELFPVRGRSCSSDQIPLLAKKFPSFESFGEANVEDMYGKGLQQALNYKAYTFASSYFENLGDGTFAVRPFPNEAQLSSVNSILTEDFNDDGNLDLLISGNLFPSEIETPRNDAGMGLFLTGDGKGNFTPVRTVESGFFAPYDAKDMKLLKAGGRKVILVANNQYFLQAIEFRPKGLKKEDTLSLK